MYYSVIVDFSLSTRTYIHDTMYMVVHTIFNIVWGRQGHAQVSCGLRCKQKELWFGGILSIHLHNVKRQIVYLFKQTSDRQEIGINIQ